MIGICYWQCTAANTACDFEEVTIIKKVHLMSPPLQITFINRDNSLVQFLAMKITGLFCPCFQQFTPFVNNIILIAHLLRYTISLHSQYHIQMCLLYWVHLPSHFFRYIFYYRAKMAAISKKMYTFYEILEKSALFSRNFRKNVHFLQKCNGRWTQY